MKTALIIITLFAFCAMAIVLGGLWLSYRLTKHELDAWRDGHSASPDDYTATVESCRECGSPKFQRKPCWHCTNQRDLQHILEGTPGRSGLGRCDARAPGSAELQLGQLNT